MIYFSNSKLNLPHMVFIGRWSPFHKGHAAIIMKKRKVQPHAPVLILIRNTPYDSFTPLARAQFIKNWMSHNNVEGTIMIIPDVEGVYWGRDVGYNLGIIDIDQDTTQISSTTIRSLIKNNKKEWKQLLADESGASMLTDASAQIIEKGKVVWLTGCPCSGKTTIATNVISQVHLHYPYLKTQLLDGDDMRSGPLAKNVGFTSKDRKDHILRMAYLAKLFADHGILVICAFVSPDRTIREKTKNIIGKDRYMEVYVKASKTTRIQRDTKGLYHKAMVGKLKGLTGFNARYMPPKKPDVICDTNKKTVEQNTRAIFNKIFNA